MPAEATPHQVAHAQRLMPEVLIPDDVQAQLETLRYFNLKVDHLDRSGFAARYAEEIPEVMAEMKNLSSESLGEGRFSVTGRVNSWLHDFNEDEIDAFVLTYRMFTQRNDRISTASLAKIYACGWMPKGAQECFEAARARINEYLSNAATIMLEDDHVSVKAIVEVVVYGGMGHSNREKTEIFESWKGSGIMGFIWAEFFAYADSCLASFDISEI